MSFFSSNRERRLWVWTAVVVAAIYSTLGLARTLTDKLGNDFFDVWLFLLGCILVLLTVITQGLKVRPGGAEIAVALGVAAAYLLILVRMSAATERSHLVEYGVVAVFIHEALRERAGQGRRVPVPAPYTPDVTMNVALLGSYMPGDWALGEHFGAMQEETHAFINSVGQRRRDPILATGEEGLNVLTVSRAVDAAALTGEAVPITWGQ